MGKKKKKEKEKPAYDGQQSQAVTLSGNAAVESQIFGRVTSGIAGV